MGKTKYQKLALILRKGIAENGGRYLCNTTIIGKQINQPTNAVAGLLSGLPDHECGRDLKITWIRDYEWMVEVVA